MPDDTQRGAVVEHSQHQDSPRTHRRWSKKQLAAFSAVVQRTKWRAIGLAPKLGGRGADGRDERTDGHHVERSRKAVLGQYAAARFERDGQPETRVTHEVAERLVEPGDDGALHATALSARCSATRRSPAAASGSASSTIARSPSSATNKRPRSASSTRWRVSPYPAETLANRVRWNSAVANAANASASTSKTVTLATGRPSLSVAASAARTPGSAARLPNVSCSAVIMRPSPSTSPPSAAPASAGGGPVRPACHAPRQPARWPLRGPVPARRSHVGTRPGAIPSVRGRGASVRGPLHRPARSGGPRFHRRLRVRCRRRTYRRAPAHRDRAGARCDHRRLTARQTGAVPHRRRTAARAKAVSWPSPRARAPSPAPHAVPVSRGEARSPDHRSEERRVGKEWRPWWIAVK